jgi:hypothetical protein
MIHDRIPPHDGSADAEPEVDEPQSCRYIVSLYIETDNPALVEQELEELHLKHGEITDVGALETPY